MGSRVRKFFKGYGFFDGSVSEILRCYINGEEVRFNYYKRTNARKITNLSLLLGSRQLEMCYRIVYEDGDSEDMSYRIISSLLRFYDTRRIREWEKIEGQVGGERELQIKGMKGRVVGFLEEWDCVVVR